MDWNLALDTTGGETFIKNFLDAAIIVNAADDSFWQQPAYFILAHFSHFLIPGSVRIGSVLSESTSVTATAFQTPEKSYAIVINNL